ncbi:MAG: sensor histidine kinase [Alphaproteobacteria bacterium]
MTIPIFRATLRTGADVVQSRQWARTVAAGLGATDQDQTRIATAVSEIARNAVSYGGGGRIEFGLAIGDVRTALTVRVSDQGRGIPDLDAVLAGRYRSKTGLGLGIPGARRLMDTFAIESGPAGTTVVMEKVIGGPVSPEALRAKAQQAAGKLARMRAADPIAEVQQQNRELLDSLHQLRLREEDLLAANERLRSGLAEKEVLLREVHHRVKNNLQIVSSLVSLQGSRARSEEAKGELSSLSGRIRSLSLIHDHLYHGENVARIELGDYIGDLCRRIADVFAEPEPRIALEHEMPAVVIPIDLAINIGLVVNELLTNSFKHAFPDGRAGRIRVAGRVAGQHLALTVRDDGIGCAPSAPKSTRRSLGTTLIETMVSRLHGRVEVDCSRGTCTRVFLTLPTADADAAPNHTI